MTTSVGMRSQLPLHPLFWVLASLGLVLLSAPVLAEVYQWIDEQGQMQFSDFPPSHAVEGGVTVKDFPVSKPKDAEESKRRWERLMKYEEAMSEERESKEEKRRAAKEEAKKEKVARKKQCLLARQNLHTLARPVPVYILNEEGEREFVSTELRMQEIARFKAMIEEYCD